VSRQALRHIMATPADPSAAKRTIHFKSRSGKYLGQLDLDQQATVEDLKLRFSTTFHYYPERQRFYIGGVKGRVLTEGKLFGPSGNGINDGESLTFKDLGVQISWRLVYVVEYFGPLLIFPLFMYCPFLFYKAPVESRTLTQKVAFVLAMFHFLKRELESLFVHRFSNGTMPFSRLPINCIHYWGLFATMVGYYLFHPKYTPPFVSPQIVYGLAALFLVFETMNFQTHLILRNLRPRGTKQRGIPSGWGFQLVSCANYWWETLTWIVFCIMTQTLTGWFFTLIAFYIMAEWAIKKHKLYKREFPSYPKVRKAIVPFLL